MDTISIILILLLAVVVSGSLARMSPITLPLPLFQIALGAAVASVAEFRVELDPEIFFLLFLPPLLFLDGWRIPKEGLFRDKGTILELALGLVVFTVVGVGAWRRAGVLYVTHIMTTVATLAIFSAAALHFSRPDLLKLINIQIIIEDTPEALVGIATLGHQIGYNNILSMYAVVLLMLPFFLWLGTISLRLMMLISALIWLIAGIFQIAPTNYPGAGFWFLNPFSWQFLFVIGIAGMLHVKHGGEIHFNWLMASTAVGYLVGALIWVRVPLWGIETDSGLPTVLTGFDKTFLSLSRLMHILAIAYLIVVIPALSKLAKVGPSHPLAVLGKHSLPVFVAGTILAMVAQVMRTVSPGGSLYDAVLILTGIALQFGFAYYLEWLPRVGWNGERELQRVAASRSVAARQTGR